MFSQKKILSKKNFSEKKFGQTKFLVKKILVKIVFGFKKISVKKIFRLKNFWLEKFWVKKFFVKTIFQFKKKFSPKNWVGLTLGRGFMTPPQKIVRLKLCEIVVSCLKRIFVPKRLIRVNPGGKVCDPPPSN